MSSLQFDNFTSEQGVYNIIFNSLEKRDLQAVACATKQCNLLIKKYDRDDTIQRIYAIAKDFLKKVSSNAKLVSLSGDSLTLTLASPPTQLLDVALSKLGIDKKELLSKRWDVILDPKTLRFYGKFNTLVVNVCEGVFNGKEALSARAQEPCAVSSPVIEKAVCQILGSSMGLSIVSEDASEGEGPTENDIRILLRLELAKLQPEDEMDGEQTLAEFERILNQTFVDIKPLYDTYGLIFSEILTKQRTEAFEAELAGLQAENDRQLEELEAANARLQAANARLQAAIAANARIKKIVMFFIVVLISLVVNSIVQNK